MDAGSWADCLWTGRAVRCHRTEASMDVMRTPDGAQIPAMPKDLFADEKSVIAWALGPVPKCDADKFQHATSMTTRLQVNCVPLKPRADRLAKPRHKAAITSRCNNLDNMYPTAIIPINIGSNRGLMQILRNHYEDNQQNIPGVPTVYKALNVDMNIFIRTLKVHCCLSLKPSLSLILFSLSDAVAPLHCGRVSGVGCFCNVCL